MKFKQYLAILNNLAKREPETLDFDVMYSVDNEGSEYKSVTMDPGSVAKSDNSGNIRFTDFETGEILLTPQCNTILIN